MTVIVGKDFAFVEKMLWGFDPIGHGKGFVLLTPERLIIFPYEATLNENVHGKIRLTDTQIQVDGIQPLEAVSALLDAQDTTVETMNQTMNRWLEQVPDGPICHDFSSIESIRIWTGWFRRSIGFKLKEKSKTGKNLGFRPNKEEIAGFVSLLEGHPLVEFIK